MALQGDAVTGKFNEMLSSPSILVITMLLITIAGFLICSVGLQNGVERVTKVMMIVLMVVMIFLAVYSFTMPGVKRGSEILSGAGHAADRTGGTVPHYHKRDEPGILYVKPWYRRDADFRQLLKRRKIAARRGESALQRSIRL